MPVPKLNLAPKLKRPLSLWNPLDYLRLLYWVFYFPQALQWYIDTFGSEYNSKYQFNWQKRQDIFYQNTIQSRLFIQILVLITITLFVPVFLDTFSFYLKEYFETIRFLDEISINWLGLIFKLNWIIIFFNIDWLKLILNMSFFMGLPIILAVLFRIQIKPLLILTLVFLFGAILDAFLVIKFLNELIIIDYEYDNLNIVNFESNSISLNVVSGVLLGLSLGATFNILFFVIVLNFTRLEWRYTIILSNIMPILLIIAFIGIFFTMVFLLSVEIGFQNTIINNILSIDVRQFISNKILWVTFILTFIHVEHAEKYISNWFGNVVSNQKKPRYSIGKFGHVTLLPHYYLIHQLPKWLQQDWEVGVSNINQILKYTFQLNHVTPLIKKTLAQLPDQEAVYRVTQLCYGIDNWILISDLAECHYEIINLATVTIKGFWDLYNNNPNQATLAFAVVWDLPYGNELVILSETLDMFQKARTTNEIANLIIPNFPTQNLLRPNTWQAMNVLRQVMENVKLIQDCASRNTRAFAFGRAIGELIDVIDNINNIPEAERELIFHIAQTWKQSLERIGKDIGDFKITQPIYNPYVIGNPVIGSSFVGREDILRELEELWITGNQLQSVVLYGHRRMGKTSILVNIANTTGSQIKVIYVNLQRLGAVSQGIPEVLMAISDEIATALDVQSPDDNDLLKIPQRTFERYLKQVVANMPYRGLIIALDEFETIEELIERGQIDPAFMGFLRGLVQMNPEKIAFAFAGLHTLEEMTADYFEPFFASVIPIRVSFLNPGATKTILANPVSNIPPFSRGARGDQNSIHSEAENNEFLLDYTGEALDLIYSLTSGQPYLVQLIGFQLVRKYNDQVFEQGRSRDNTFTVEDIEAVINQKFFQQGRYYFEGVWGQASQGETGQQEIITALATHPQGLSQENLASITGLDTETLAAAIETLKRHDVIAEKDAHYYIVVELFRRWLLMK